MITKYANSFVKNSFKIENEKDIKNNIDTIVNDIDSVINDFHKNFSNMKKSNEQNTTLKNIQPLNQILYGPPGTGKTYNTVIKAMEIIDPTNNIENYKELKDKFDKLKQSGQIKFITFHQSYSYEEFIEGIKPDVKNSEKIMYRIENGIFKEIVDDALFDKLNITEQQEQREKEFDEILNIFKLNHQEGSELNTISSQSKFTIVEYLKDSIRIKPKDGSYIYSVSYEPLQEIYEKDKENNISTAKELIERMGGRFAGLSSYYFAVLNSMKQYTNQINTTNQKTINFDKAKFLKEYYNGNIKLKENSNKYILIIDEINRGNISKIFGEMITLIEEDKRIGNEHELKLTLPYSKEQFGISNNLYIIGTMNTSDRSIASVDIALRRRFKFIEMMPENKLVADFEIKFNELFESLNNKIKILLDRDHQIGHSYFINTKYNNDNGNNDIETLKNIWFDEILPLLNEYFYNDWNKLQALLGEAEIKGENNSSFIVKSDLSKYKMKDIDKEDKFIFDFVDRDKVNFQQALLKITELVKNNADNKEVNSDEQESN
jgi:5-methylcytosine-specific restriction protein B